MTKGRFPVPEGIKTLRAKQREGRLGGAKKGAAVVRMTCPGHLSANAKQEWVRVVRALRKAGNVTPLDRAVLSAYCATWARWIEAEQKAGRCALVIQGHGGRPVANPYLLIARQALEQLRRLAGDLGLTPSARTRFTPLEPAEGDALEEFLQQRPARLAVGDRPDMKKAVALAKARDAREAKEAKARETPKKRAKPKKRKGKRKPKTAGRRRGVGVDPGATGTSGAPSRAALAEGAGGGIEPPGHGTKPETENRR